MESELKWILTNSRKADMISYLTSHPKKFEEAIRLALADEQPFSWRAAWLLWSCMEENDPRIAGFLKSFIDSLPEKKENQQRELLIILQKMEINEELEGVLYSHCVSIWETINKMPSVRYNAFKMMAKIVKKHPELLQEIHLFTQNQYMDSLSINARKSIFEMIKF